MSVFTFKYINTSLKLINHVVRNIHIANNNDYFVQNEHFNKGKTFSHMYNLQDYDNYEKFLL